MKENRDILTLCERAFLAAPLIDTSIPLKVYGISDPGAVCKKLLGLYGDAEVMADGESKKLSDIKYASEIEAPALPDFCKKRYNAVDAVRVTERLTRPGDGCPWDRVQTHDSMRMNMIEEAYEAVDAIDKRDLPNMLEEFGDVFLQALLHSDVSRRSGEFDFDDVCDGLCKKLISRHTFIFGADSAHDPDEALGLWEKAKAGEKNYDCVKDQLSRLPDTFPALLLAQKTHKKLKKAGAEPDPQGELDAALSAGNWAAAIAALAALLADEGKDAEVELNRLIKERISSL